jgi:glycosyltransferase involved in cell wall biosynthesis
MQILLVHADAIPWATTFRAQALKQRWTQDEVSIARCDALPDGNAYDVVHFLYSASVTRSIAYIRVHKHKVFTSLASQRTLDCRYDSLSLLVDIYQNTVCCVAQNPTLAAQLKQLIGKDNVVYIPNGVDEKLFDREFVVGLVGAANSSDHKGYGIAAQACKELGIKLRTSLGCARAHDDMPSFYREIDCLLVLSKSEGCSNPILEALAMNVPVISTDTGIARLLEGVYCVERNVESVKAALRKVSGRLQILESYTWNSIAAQYRALYTARL